MSDSVLATPVITPAREPVPVKWYRSPLPREDMMALLSRSDVRAFAQTIPHVTLIIASGAATYLALMQPAMLFDHWSPWVLLAALPLLLLHGFLCSFAINAVHELGHGTVFKTKWLNRLFEGFFAFIGWIHQDQFTVSHTRHHRYTLHAPDDQEVTLPSRFETRWVWQNGGIFNWRILRWYFDAFLNQLRIMQGKSGFDGPWNAVLFPADQPQQRIPIKRWAAVLFFGHLTVLIGSLACGWWALPLVVSLTPNFGASIQGLMNNTQHIGMMKDVGDARLCCRTFTAHPILEYFYWHMNYHIEHHMFAAVPCYRLKSLHRLISFDLPPTPHGLRATWMEINRIQELQKANPSYEERPALPSGHTPSPTAVPVTQGALVPA